MNMRNSSAALATVATLLLSQRTAATAIHVKILESHLDHHSHTKALEAETTAAETIDWSGQRLTSWKDVEVNLTSTVESLDVSSNELEAIDFTETFPKLQTLLCANASLKELNVNVTRLKTLSASNNLLSSFHDVVLATTIETLDLSANELSDWGNFVLPRDLQTLNVSHNSIAKISGFDLSVATDLVSIDLSFNDLTSVVGVIFPNNLVDLDLSGNKIDAFEVRETDLAVLFNLGTFKMDDLKQSSCPTSSATIEVISNVQICVVSDAVFMSAHSGNESASISDTIMLCISVIVSALISLWFVVLLVGHGISTYRNAATKPDQQRRDTVEITVSRHWSQSREEDLPDDLRSDKKFTSSRIDTSDVMQIRTLAHGNFAMVSLVYLGDKQAVVKKVSVQSQGQDRDQMIAFMSEIRVCAKLDHPMIVAFFGIMWSGLSDLASIVEYVPRGSLAAYLKTKKSSQQNAQSTFTWIKSSSESPAKLSLALQISEALVYLQSLAPPIVHGHLRADSILLGLEWNVKLNRLGYVLDPSSLPMEVQAWSAPEVLTSGDFDEKSDIYSFGVVLSELDRCKLPFSRKAMQRQCNDGGTFPKPKFGKDCPSKIVELAQSCLRDDPAARPTATELCNSLRQIQCES